MKKGALKRGVRVVELSVEPLLASLSIANGFCQFTSKTLQIYKCYLFVY